MYDIPDHYIIRNMELTGYPDGQEPPVPHCPMCGAECDTIYTSKQGGHVLGGENCITEHGAFLREECFPDKEEPDERYCCDE